MVSKSGYIEDFPITPMPTDYCPAFMMYIIVIFQPWGCGGSPSGPHHGAPQLSPILWFVVVLTLLWSHIHLCYEAHRKLGAHPCPSKCINNHIKAVTGPYAFNFMFWIILYVIFVKNPSFSRPVVKSHVKSRKHAHVINIRPD